MLVGVSARPYVLPAEQIESSLHGHAHLRCLLSDLGRE
jgi:hypothetical protein